MEKIPETAVYIHPSRASRKHWKTSVLSLSFCPAGKVKRIIRIGMVGTIPQKSENIRGTFRHGYGFRTRSVRHFRPRNEQPPERLHLCERCYSRLQPTRNQQPHSTESRYSTGRHKQACSNSYFQKSKEDATNHSRKYYQADNRLTLYMQESDYYSFHLSPTINTEVSLYRNKRIPL